MFRQAAAKKILGAWQRARNEQKESKQELKDTQRAVQALQQQGSSRAGGEVQDKGQPAPVTAGCGGRIGCRGRIEGGRGGSNRSKKQVSTVSLGSSASGALSAVSQQGQLGHHKKKRKTAHQKCDEAIADFCNAEGVCVYYCSTYYREGRSTSSSPKAFVR